MLSLPEMAAKGEAKLRTKASTMVSSWSAAKSRMKSGYGATPFGPTRKAAYGAGIDAATYHAPDPGKWSTNWQAKMSE